MSEGPQPIHPSIKKDLDAWNDGFFDRPGTADVPRDAAAQAAYDRGKRLREMGRTPSGGVQQTLGEAIHMAFGLAGAAAGLLFGLRRVGAGEGTWMAVLLLTLGGFGGGMIVWAAVVWSFGRTRDAVVWRRGRDERDAAMLQDMWEARFGHPIAPELLAEVEDDGSAWTMDGAGNVHLRMVSGKVFFVGIIDGDLRTEVRGRGGTPTEDAYHSVLIHRSLGHRQIRITEGSKKHKRCLWAAASLLDMKVEGYTPDAKAVRLLATLKRDGRAAPGGTGGDGASTPDAEEADGARP